MQSFASKGDGGAGTHTCELEHPPPTLAGWHARAVSDQADGGKVFVRLGVHVPFSGRAGMTLADSASAHPVPTQNPMEVYGMDELEQGVPAQPAAE
jgi:hypothetical protein